MPSRRILVILSPIACMLVGCTITKSVSSTPRYAPYIGRTVYLKNENWLQDVGLLDPFHQYQILPAFTDSYHEIVADLPPDTPVNLVSVRQRLYLKGGYLPSGEDYATVTISVPGKPSRIRALLRVPSGEQLPWQSISELKEVAQLEDSRKGPAGTP